MHAAPLVATISHRTREDPNSRVFMEYIGSKFTGVRFSDVPINPNIDFHFILSSAIDYSPSPSPTPTDGDFNVFWDTHNLTPSQVTSIKQRHHNVKFALSLGGHRAPAYFNPTSIDSWVSNAVSSLTTIINHYNLDGIDVDYEHFNADPATFAECIGRLLTTLKLNGVISFASIAPDEVQRHYQALWSEYGHVIHYVNFQFYAYNAGTTESQFLSYYERQCENYEGGKIMVGMVSDGSGGLTPENGFYSACYTLKEQGRLPGIFIWSADDSMASGFTYERDCQTLLATD